MQRKDHGRAERRRRPSAVGMACLAVVLGAAAMGAGPASAAVPASKCPEGSTYNKKTKVCEMPPTYVCPTGSSYEPSSGLCVASATLSGCSDPRLTFDGRYGGCVGPSFCPAGYQMGAVSADTDRFCENGVDFVPPQCPEGADYLPFSLREQCLAPAVPACATGLSYDGDSERCVAVPATACPEPFGFNVLTRKCQAVPVKGSKT